MPVKIRLSRWGRRNNPFYGIVVARVRAPRDRNFLERVGTYNPIPQDGIKHLELDKERIKYWLGVGAQPTAKVAWLLSKADLMPNLPKQQPPEPITKKPGIAQEQYQQWEYRTQLTEKEALVLLQRNLGIA